VKHLDEDGNTCTEHVASDDALLTFAAIGSRVSTFNHDIASKLQGMMMALDEIEELLERVGDSDLRRATETAQQALKEANALLSANRSLTRTSTKTKAQVADLVKTAGDRAHVEVRGDVPEGQVEGVIALLAQGLGLAIDALAGTGRGRFVDVIATREGDLMKLTFASTADPTKTFADALHLASFVITRANGVLRCGRDRRIHVQLPLVG
jgi:signal transduction histidine kinase